MRYSEASIPPIKAKVLPKTGKGPVNFIVSGLEERNSTKEPSMARIIPITVYFFGLILNSKKRKIATNMGFKVTKTVEFMMEVYLREVIQVKKWKARKSEVKRNNFKSFLLNSS